VHYPLPDGCAVVLGEMAASILGTVKAGERCSAQTAALSRDR
jgi:hypothetical protein